MFGWQIVYCISIVYPDGMLLPPMLAPPPRLVPPTHGEYLCDVIICSLYTSQINAYVSA